ncbi:MAG: hypothetical protein CSA32_00450 [Desulfobulbus propionicus]|nr:MAG: hypothetical protein CSA32_00450 [Desulfobulbus propionicus]
MSGSLRKIVRQKNGNIPARHLEIIKEIILFMPPAIGIKKITDMAGLVYLGAVMMSGWNRHRAFHLLKGSIKQNHCGNCGRKKFADAALSAQSTFPLPFLLLLIRV